MMSVSLNMYMTLAVAVIVLLIGAWLRKKIKLLDKFCIPMNQVSGLYVLLLSVIILSIRSSFFASNSDTASFMNELLLL